MAESSASEANSETGNATKFSKSGENESKSILAQPNQEFLDSVSEVFERIDKLEIERKELNDRIKAEKASLEKHGINNHAFKAVKAFRKLNEEQQDNYDLSNQVLRRAIGQPVQMSLFEAQIERTH